MLRGCQEARGSFEEKNAVEETQVPPSASSLGGESWCGPWPPNLDLHSSAGCHWASYRGCPLVSSL